MNLPLVPQLLVTGILNGGVIGLIALGVVLIFKSSEVFNFSQGHLVLLGAFLTWWFAGGNEDGLTPLNLPLLAAVLASIAVVAVVGFVIERLALRPMTGQPLLAIILMTVGLSQLLEGLITLVFGVEPRSNYPSPLPASALFTVMVPGALNDRIIIRQALVAAFIIAILSALAFGLFFRYTRAGLAMRATAENHDLARSMGINVPRVFALSWAIAGMIATVGGVLLAMLSGASITLALVALVTFPAILLGGLESFPGAILGGIIIGLSQAFVQASTNPDIRQSVEIAPYVILLIVLIIRPEGLFGQKRIERI
jgi:branched-chain amino acid transport system permease protein